MDRVFNRFNFTVIFVIYILTLFVFMFIHSPVTKLFLVVMGALYILFCAVGIFYQIRLHISEIRHYRS
jgi:hypothetical protein